MKSNDQIATPQEKLEELIVKALRHYNGKASAKKVVDFVGNELKDKLTEPDKKWREKSNKLAWQHNTHWARNTLKNKGVIKKESKRGIWELNEKYLND